MKIKINREIEVPDRLICTGSRSECSALYRISDEGTIIRDYAHCRNFNQNVFWGDNAGYFVKCRACIDATLDHFHGRTK